MTDLPPGWARAPLSEIVDVLDNRRIPVNAKERAKRPGDVPYYGATGRVGWIDRPIFDENLVVLGEDGVQFFDHHKPKAYLISGPAWVNNHAHVLRCQTSAVNRRYLCHYLNYFDYRGYAGGTTRLKLNQSAMNSIPIVLPPRKEQRRIVAALDDHLSRLEAAASGVQRAVRRAMSLEESLLHSAVTGCLATRRSARPMDWPNEISTKRRKLVHKGHEAAAPTKIPGYRLPTGWGLASLDALSYASGYGTSAKCGYNNAGGTAVLRIPNIQRGEVVFDDLKYAVDPTLDLSSLYLAPGDILFIRTNGSRDLIGRIAVVREKMDVAFASYLIRFRLVPEGVSADWIRLVVNSPLWRRYLEAMAASSAGQHNLSTRVLAPLAIPVPPSEELANIQSAVEQFFAMTKVCRRTSQSLLKRSAALRRALLSEAFAGRLVAQDPGDEPASVLLERIRQERAAQPKPQRRRRAASGSQEEALL